MRKSLLFIAWDGPDVNYLEGLFMPIFAGLLDDYDIHIMQFTWGDENKTALLHHKCAQLGVHYTREEIYRKPVATAGVIITLLKGAKSIQKYVAKNNISILMPRSTMPAWMVMRAIKYCPQIRLVFDADGLPLEERVDFAGLKKTGFQYKYLKSIEQGIINQADVVLARTQKAVQYLTVGKAVSASKFFVVVNGRNEEVFKPAVKMGNPIRKKLGIPDCALLVVYAGSLGPQYCLGEMIALFKILQEKKHNSYLLLLTGSQQYAANNAQLWAGLEKNVVVANVPFSEVPLYLSLADAALAFRRDYFSMAGVAPVKLGEYLLSGLPVVLTPNTGDTKKLLQNNNACFLLDTFSSEAFTAAADWLAGVHLNSPVAIEARKTGQALFSLKAAVASYKNALNALP